MEIEIISEGNAGDFSELLNVFEKVFEMTNFVKPDHEYLRGLLKQENFIVVAAKEGQQVIGGLTAYRLKQYYSTKTLVYIYDLAVLNEFQRKGIGKKIIEFIIDYSREMGCEEVYVQAEKEDVHA